MMVLLFFSCSRRRRTAHAHARGQTRVWGGAHLESDATARHLSDRSQCELTLSAVRWVHADVHGIHHLGAADRGCRQELHVEAPREHGVVHDIPHVAELRAVHVLAVDGPVPLGEVRHALGVLPRCERIVLVRALFGMGRRTTHVARVPEDDRVGECRPILVPREYEIREHAPADVGRRQRIEYDVLLREQREDDRDERPRREVRLVVEYRSGMQSSACLSRSKERIRERPCEMGGRGSGTILTTRAEGTWPRAFRIVGRPWCERRRRVHATHVRYEKTHQTVPPLPLIQEKERSR
jgi:hypothetical protein